MDGSYSSGRPLAGQPLAAPRAQLYCGDCLEVMPYIPSGSADMILCDLPYGTTACKWDAAIPFAPMWGQFRRLCSGAVVLTATQPFTSALVMSNTREFKHEWIWRKSKCGSAFAAKYRPLAKHESVLIFGQGRINYNPQMRPGEPYRRDRKPGAINNHNLGLGKGASSTVNEGWRYPETVIDFQQKWRRQDQVHPTQKPVALMEYLIRTYTDEGDTVLDCCMGSGTTGVAAINTGRNFIGIERDPKYYEIAKQRIAAATSSALSVSAPILEDIFA